MRGKGVGEIDSQKRRFDCKDLEKPKRRASDENRKEEKQRKIFHGQDACVQK